MVVRLIEAQGTELALDFELAPNVYAKAKVRPKGGCLAELLTLDLFNNPNVILGGL